MRCTRIHRAVCLAALVMLFGAACTSREQESSAGSLPTRQTTIDPVKKKLEAAQQDAERRRSEAERVGQ